MSLPRALRRATAPAIVSLVLWLAPAPALAAPPNDDFTRAQTLLADAGSLLATNVGADRETGEPDHGNLGGASVWYRWTPVADGVMGIVATGLGEMLIGVYVGDAPGRLVSLESNSGTPAAVAFLATGGTEYHIAVDGFDGLVGPFSLTWGPLPEARELEAREHEAEWPSPMAGAQLRALDELGTRVRGASARFLFNLRVGNGRQPFAGDRRLLTTVSPNGDGFRDTAIIRFTLARAATVRVEAYATRVGLGDRAWSVWRRFGPGPHRVVWKPGGRVAPRVFLLHVTAVDGQGNRTVVGKRSPHATWPPAGPVVRVRGLDAGFRSRSYRPGALAALRVATDVRRFTVQFFRAGPNAQPRYARDRMQGAPVSDPLEVDWSSHRSAPATLWLRLGDWETGVYFARLSGEGGRVGFAPFVLRPRRLGLHRIAVVLPTNTWQAYNFQDVDGDGWGNTWYASHATQRIDLTRAYYRGGSPGPWLYDRGFVRWLWRTGKHPDYLSQDDIQGLRGGAQLAAAYDLVVYSGHSEYVTGHEYNMIQRFRDLGGNLMFLGANNFYRRVDRFRQRLTLRGLWRDFGRPEARLLGVQYIGWQPSTYGDYIVTGRRIAPWVFDGTGLRNGSRFGRFGREIDQRNAFSPSQTRRLAWIPDLFGPGQSAEMTFYRRNAAKVFSAGTVNFGASSLHPVISGLLENLWARLRVP
jgi:hypothetical protein